MLEVHELSRTIRVLKLDRQQSLYRDCDCVGLAHARNASRRGARSRITGLSTALVLHLLPSPIRNASTSRKDEPRSERLRVSVGTRFGRFGFPRIARLATLRPKPRDGS